jgi:threonine aldolase
MRQAGILAAAGLYALEHNRDRLAEDHENARALAVKLASSRCVEVALETVQTNILVFRLTPASADVQHVVTEAHERGVLVLPFGPRTIRAVTHLDVSRKECEQAADILLGVLEGQ